MPEPALSPHSPLAGLVNPGHYGVQTAEPGLTIALRDDVALAAVMARNGQASELAKKVTAVYGLELPLAPKRVSAGAVSFAWAGPNQWLAAVQRTEGYIFEQALRRDFGSFASIANQSDGRSLIRVGGPMARRVLAKGVPLDLHPLSFGPGDTALTVAGRINTHFWQIDDRPTYEFAVFRSFAAAFCTWLLEAAAEFGAIIKS